MEQSGPVEPFHPGRQRPLVDDLAAAGGQAPAQVAPLVPAISLEELAADLERSPEDCRQACEGLEAVDVETRVKLIEGLTAVPRGEGVIRLLELLAASPDLQTRTAAMAARARVRPPGVLVRSDEVDRPHLVDCLVTAVDGAGGALIVLSATRWNGPATAMFLCDVERGITGVLGQVETSAEGGRGLLQGAHQEAGSLGIAGDRELALRLLAGTFWLSGPDTPPTVLEWLEKTLGNRFQPAPFPAPAMDGGAEPPEGRDLRGG